MTTKVEVCNLTDMQLEVPVKDVYGNEDSVLLQPKARRSLPEGMEPINPKQRGLYIVPPTVAVVETTPAKKTTVNEVAK